MGFSFTSFTCSMAFPHSLFTVHASRTHVKAPQTDFPVKPDNSSRLTQDSQSKRPLRKKATFQSKTSAEKHGEHQAARDPPKPSTDQLCSMLPSSRESEPRPEGQHRDQDDIHLDAQSHGKSFEASGQDPWLHAVMTKPSRLGSHRSRLPIPWVGIASPPDSDRLPAGAVLFRVSLEYPT